MADKKLIDVLEEANPGIADALREEIKKEIQEQEKAAARYQANKKPTDDEVQKVVDAIMY